MTPGRRILLALVVPLLGLPACGQTEAVRATAPSVSPSTNASATPGFPPRAQVRHGDEVYGVYVAVKRTPSAPELAQAKRDLTAAGYSGYTQPGAGDINCDQGAREALRLDPRRAYHAVAIYFRTVQEAQQFVDAFKPGVVGTAQVKLYCRD
ncbi:MAG TPA: hypothetical protein VNT52_05800 [Acidimicrobiales bacterium]|nr:hypothetical protein [Acidimicrobiales bacterium]